MILAFGYSLISLILLMATEGRCDSQEARGYFREGLSHFDSGDYRAALEAFEKAVAADPGMSPALFNMGIIHKRQGSAEEAAKAFGRVVEIDPRNTSAYLELAGLHATAGRLKEAEDVLRRAVNVAPEGTADAAQAYYSLGTVLLWQKRYEEAEAYLRRAASPGWAPRERLDWRVIIRGPGPALINYTRAALFWWTDLYGKLEEYYQRAAASNPVESKAQFNLGWVYVAQGRWDEAKDAYERAVAADSTSAEALCALGDVDMRTGRGESAARMFERALERDSSNAWAIYGLGNARLRQGRIAEGRELLKRFRTLSDASLEAARKGMRGPSSGQ